MLVTQPFMYYILLEKDQVKCKSPSSKFERICPSALRILEIGIHTYEIRHIIFKCIFILHKYALVLVLLPTYIFKVAHFYERS